MSVAVPEPIGVPGEMNDREQRRLQAERETQVLVDGFSPSNLRWNNVDWTVAIFLIAIHAGCIAAPFFFSWTGLAVCLVMHWATCSLGICLGFHRFLSHRSMRLRAPAEFVLMAIGCLAGEGTPLQWAANHRLHHQRSDQDGDPHSPKDGPWWSHLIWLFPRRSDETTEILFRRYVPELVDRPMMRFFQKTFPLWLWGSGLAMLGAGWAFGGWRMGVSLLVWGMCVRMTAAYHSTWFVNSATHIWGYRNYDTRDMSRNLWWVAILAYGEGWHNNHHAHPSVAPAGHKWWEFDITWWSIRLLRATGLAYDVKDRIPEGRKAADGDPEEPASDVLEQIRKGAAPAA